MKKIKLKENQFDLKHGFILELVKHPKGDQYGNLEGFLSHSGVEVDISKVTSYIRFYGDKVEAILDFTNRYLRKESIENFITLAEQYGYKREDLIKKD